MAESPAIIGHPRENAPERQHGLEAFADREDVIDEPEAYARPELVSKRATRVLDRRLARPVASEPGPVHGGDAAVHVGDRGEERGPSLAWRLVRGAIVAAGMEPQAREFVERRDDPAARR